MRSKLRFHKQETPDSCLPACLRMVLMAMGIAVSEAELRKRCDCTMFGTDAFMAVDALRGLGFERSRKETGSIAGLMMELSAGQLPIVFVNLLPIDGIKVSHAMVVMDIQENGVHVCDPRLGERIIARVAFEAGWVMMQGLVILVE